MRGGRRADDLWQVDRLGGGPVGVADVERLDLVVPGRQRGAQRGHAGARGGADLRGSIHKEPDLASGVRYAHRGIGLNLSREGDHLTRHRTPHAAGQVEGRRILLTI